MPDRRSPSSEFTALLEGVLDAAYGTAYHLTGHRADAEELVQEASLLAHKGFDRFEPGTNFKAWFLTILRNRFVSDYRKKKRSVQTVDVDDIQELYLYTKSEESGLSQQVTDPAKFLIDGLDHNQITAALARLPDEFREVCILYFTQDLTYQEIATVLDIPTGTVRSRLHRGRRLLQRELWTLAVDHGIVSPGAPAEATSGDVAPTND